MPKPLLADLRRTFPAAAPYLMYGLTEAFRSTYLDPREVQRRPDSIGKAIPNAEILVVRADGTLCGPGEEGELVHRGPLVARGYWNDPVLTRTKFRPLPNQLPSLPLPEPCVFSGDLVRRDAEGFLYYVGRSDDMIKVGGARVSPTEIEEVLYETGLVHEAAAFGISDDMLGQRIVACVVANPGATETADRLMHACRAALPSFMVPTEVRLEASLPRSPNGKIDRKALRARVAEARGGAGELQA
jgi:acyl-CoA synthetase (AMP-forming)/AMP-acid ligase II